jgi:CO dehydrogenase maturation factor
VKIAFAGKGAALVGNKVQTPEDAEFLRSHSGKEPLAWIGHEPAVRAMEQGRPFSLDDLSPATAAALSAIQSRLDAAPRDWVGYSRLAAEFHRRNARAWASDQAGEDLAGQIDPDFTLGPHALALATTGAPAEHGSAARRGPGVTAGRGRCPI